MRLRPVFSLRSALIGLSATLGLGAAQSDRARPEIRAIRLADDDDVRLDGRLDESFWQLVSAPATNFLQQEPVEGAAATESTEVRIVYDENNLYLGVRLIDSEPGGIIGNQKQRDGSLRGDDRFMFILDTFLDGRSAYFFETNPAGLMGDGLLQVGSGRGLNKSWDGIWEARAARDDDGWSVEIEIPFRTLNFDPGKDSWGIDFQRTIRRKQEETLWSGFRINEGLFLPVNAGRLVGLEGMTQGLGLEVTPYGLASHRKDEEGSETPADAGFDLNYSVTPGLRAAVTVNTDFAEVEVDQRRVNLTRFPLFFPERRDFFLEGSNVYRFAGANGAFPYFSRRIGLVGGSPIPIVFGARLNGRSGRFDIGLLQVRTAEDEDNPVEDFTVARVKRNFFAQSSFGVIYTRRATGAIDQEPSPEVRQTLGVDLDLLTANFLGDKNLQFEAFAVVHTDPFQPAEADLNDRSVRGVRINFPNDRWRGHASYRQFGANYDPAVGFNARNGFRRFQPSFAFSPRPADSEWVRQFEWEVYFEHLTDLDNKLLTRVTRADLVNIRFNSGDEASVRFQNRFEFLDEPFEIEDGIIIPAGDHEFNDVTVEFEAASQRRVAGEVAMTRGGFWSGTRTGWETELVVRPIPGVLIGTEWERDDVSLPEGDFVATVFRQRGEWQLSPWISTTAVVQYDNVSKITGLYARFHWILKPGSDLFVVYSHNWQTLEARTFTLERSATTKINYTHRF